MSLFRTLLIVAGLGLATAAAVAAWPVVQGSNAGTPGFGDGATTGHDHHEAGEHDDD